MVSGEPTGIGAYLLTQGVLGIAVLLLLFICNKLYNAKEKVQAEKDVLQKEKQDIIDARRLESVQTTKEVLEVLQGNSQSNRILAEKIEVGKRGDQV